MINYPTKFASKPLLLMSLLFLSGCIGISVVSEKEKRINYPLFDIGSERAKFLDIPASHHFLSNPNYISYKYSKQSKEDVIILWGEPDKKSIKDGLDYWYYKREIGFSGIVLGAIIPIPILVPTGYRDTILVFENNQVKTIIREYGGQSHGFNCLALVECTTMDIWNIEQL